MPPIEETPTFIEDLALRMVPDPPPTEPVPDRCTRRELVQLMRPIERGVILRGALAGALCGLATYWGFVTAEPLYLDVHDGSPWWTNWAFHSVSLGIAIFATIIEVTYLYYDGIRGALALGRLSRDATRGRPSNPERLRRALVRAGLEISDQRRPLHGIDPLQETSRWRLAIFTGAYKLKVTASNFVIKALVRRFANRILGRSVGRSIVEMVAIPVFAAWNAWVCGTIMMQARVRAMGQPLIDELFELAFPHGVGAIPRHLQQACFLAIREQVVRSAGFHHNMVLMAHRFMDEATEAIHTQEDLPKDLSTCIKTLSTEERAAVMEFFIALCALDGRVWRWEKRKLKILLSEVDLKTDAGQLKKYRKVVRTGYPLKEVAGNRMNFHAILPKKTA